MDNLYDPHIDTIPITYTNDGNDGPVSSGGSCDIDETTFEPGMPIMDLQEEHTSIAISTAFNAYMDIDIGGSDMILVSKDAVHFFVQRSRLLDASNNQFASLINPYFYGPLQIPRETLQLTEDALTLNVVLHIIYHISFRLYSPPLEVLLQAVKTLGKYGIALDLYLCPGTFLFDDIVLQMPRQPLEVYIVAAEYDLFELARAASGCLLSISPLSISKPTLLRLNSEYMSMLYNMHISRANVLQRIVSRQPDEHEPTSRCGLREYQMMKVAWSATTSHFVLGARPDVSAALIRNTLESFKYSLPCTQCQQCVQRRINEVLLKWTITPRTICRNWRDFFIALPPKDLQQGST
ncbi:hypothetical protein QCA50_006435 [Cerrena zonata]|uniref:BTB domain-containing protein n=1 Tax=Cerrena zonata TaxID=2478898 RepID=A0AAW0G8W6_9APHY